MLASKAHKLGDNTVRTTDIHINEDITFEGLILSEATLAGLAACDFQKPSPIQFKAIPFGKCGFDLIAQAKSGTGKTCMFGVIALEMLELPSKSLQVLILAPTREIAVQVSEVISTIGQGHKGLKVAAVIGGLPVEEDRRKVRGAHVLVATPGRLRQLLSEGTLDVSHVRLLVLDEADKLLDPSFISDVGHILSLVPEKRQTVASSATYTAELKDFLEKIMRNPVRVSPEACHNEGSGECVLLGVRQCAALVQSHKSQLVRFQRKLQALMALLSVVPFKQCLVFNNMHGQAEASSHLLTGKGWPTQFISGHMEQHRRLQAISDLVNFRCRVLLSTDLSSRGLDAANVDLVVNMDIPRSAATYLHRVGRSGRFGTRGLVVSLCENSGQELEQLQAMSATIPVDLGFFCVSPSLPVPPDLQDIPLPSLNSYTVLDFGKTPSEILAARNQVSESRQIEPKIDSDISESAGDSAISEKKTCASVSETNIDLPISEKTAVSTTSEKTIDSSISEKTLDSSSISEKTIDSSISEKTIDPPISEKTIDSPISEKTIDPPISEKTIDSSISEKTIDPPISEKTIVSSTSETTIDSSISEKTIDPSISEKTIDSPISKKSTVPSISEKITVSSIPSKTIDSTNSDNIPPLTSSNQELPQKNKDPTEKQSSELTQEKKTAESKESIDDLIAQLKRMSAPRKKTGVNPTVNAKVDSIPQIKAFSLKAKISDPQLKASNLKMDHKESSPKSKDFSPKNSQLKVDCNLQTVDSSPKSSLKDSSHSKLDSNLKTNSTVDSKLSAVNSSPITVLSKPPSHKILHSKKEYDSTNKDSHTKLELKMDSNPETKPKMDSNLYIVDSCPKIDISNNKKDSNNSELDPSPEISLEHAVQTIGATFQFEKVLKLSVEASNLSAEDAEFIRRKEKKHAGNPNAPKFFIPSYMLPIQKPEIVRRQEKCSEDAPGYYKPDCYIWSRSRFKKTLWFLMLDAQSRQTPACSDVLGYGNLERCLQTYVPGPSHSKPCLDQSLNFDVENLLMGIHRMNGQAITKVKRSFLKHGGVMKYLEMMAENGGDEVEVDVAKSFIQFERDPNYVAPPIVTREQWVTGVKSEETPEFFKVGYSESESAQDAELNKFSSKPTNTAQMKEENSETGSAQDAELNKFISKPTNTAQMMEENSETGSSEDAENDGVNKNSFKTTSTAQMGMESNESVSSDELNRNSSKCKNTAHVKEENSESGSSEDIENDETSKNSVQSTVAAQIKVSNSEPVSSENDETTKNSLKLQMAVETTDNNQPVDTKKSEPPHLSSNKLKDFESLLKSSQPGNGHKSEEFNASPFIQQNAETKPKTSPKLYSKHGQLESEIEKNEFDCTDNIQTESENDTFWTSYTENDQNSEIKPEMHNSNETREKSNSGSYESFSSCTMLHTPPNESRLKYSTPESKVTFHPSESEFNSPESTLAFHPPESGLMFPPPQLDASGLSFQYPPFPSLEELSPTTLGLWKQQTKLVTFLNHYGSYMSNMHNLKQ